MIIQFFIILLWTAPVQSGSGFKRSVHKTQSLLPKNILAIKNKYHSSKRSEQTQKISSQGPIEVRLGFCGPMQFPHNIISKAIISGINCKFLEEVNRGGIAQRIFPKLIIANDQSNPVLTRQITKNFLQQNIDILFGNPGTTSVLNIFDKILNQDLQLLFPYASHDKMLSPYAGGVIGARDEKLMLNRLCEFAIHSKGKRNFFIVYPQSDAGQELADMLQELFKDFQLKNIAKIGLDQENPQILYTTKTIEQAQPEAIIFLTNAIVSSRLIHQLSKKSPNLIFLGLEELEFACDLCPGAYKKIFYATVSPQPWQIYYPIVEKYLNSLARFYPTQQPSTIGLLYYINATLVCRALAACVPKIQKGNLKSLLRGELEMLKDYDIGGFIADFCYTNRQAYPLDPCVVQRSYVNKKTLSSGTTSASSYCQVLSPNTTP